MVAALRRRVRGQATRLVQADPSPGSACFAILATLSRKGRGRNPKPTDAIGGAAANHPGHCFETNVIVPVRLGAVKRHETGTSTFHGRSRAGRYSLLHSPV